MSLITKYGVVLPSGLMLLGGIIMAGVAIQQSGVARNVAFVGAVIFIVGLGWNYFVNKRNSAPTPKQ